MTRRIGNTIIVEDEPEAICELCGNLTELRPYGPDGKRICTKCAAEDWANVRYRMQKYAEGVTEFIDNRDNHLSN